MRNGPKTSKSNLILEGYGLCCTSLANYIQRKTGVMLKPGLRDEHGLENIEGIFSSPEKSPARQNRLSQISTISEGESMDIGQSKACYAIIEPSLFA